MQVFVAKKAQRVYLGVFREEAGPSKHIQWLSIACIAPLSGLRTSCVNVYVASVIVPCTRPEATDIEPAVAWTGDIAR